MPRKLSVGSFVLKPSRKSLALLPILLVGLTAVTAPAQSRRDAVSKNGMVVSRSIEASDVGAAILKKGGNAVDAAVATAFALAVTEPSAGNIGGGGFMMIHPSDGSPPVFIDYRDKAPLASTVDMYVDGGSRKNHKYVGVPGTVKGMALAHELYGSLTWKEVVEPAVKLARDGFELRDLAGSLNGLVKRSNNKEFTRVYGKDEGRSEWESTDYIKLPDLAKSLSRIAEHGANGFYRGETARLIAEEMRRGGGYVTEEDLKRYQARVRVPKHTTYRGYDVYSPPPPSSGGTCIVQMLNVLENFDLKSMGRWSPEANHLIIEAMRRAYADRAKYLGDPDFVEIPDHLVTKAYAKKLAASIDLKKATPSDTLGPKITTEDESPETTHFSVMDGSGMAVSNTYTLQQGYGSGVVVTGAGFLLDNLMGDFNGKPGVTDRQGTIGTLPNQIEPGKRMLSSMSPTIVAKDGKAFLVTGSPGGRTIINTVLCVTLNVLEFGMGIREAVDAPRTTHQWFPERVRFMGADDEKHKAMVEKLRSMGHEISPSNGQGDANSILFTDGKFVGAADNRSGCASGG